MMNFSFAGLGSATERLIRSTAVGMNVEYTGRSVVEENVKREVARLFQVAAIEHVTQKIRMAILKMDSRIELGGVVISGGVASNQYLRDQYASSI